MFISMVLEFLSPPSKTEGKTNKYWARERLNELC